MNTNFNPIINTKNYFQVGIVASLLTFSSCGQANNLGVKKVFIVPGLGGDNNSEELNTLTDKLEAKVNDAKVYLIKVSPNLTINQRQEAVMQYISSYENLDANTPLDERTPLVLIGHSFGGPLVVSLQKKILNAGGNIEAIATINGAMGGIQLDVQDPLSLEIAKLVTADLKEDEAALVPNSYFLKEVQSIVQQSTIPIFSIGSKYPIPTLMDAFLKSFHKKKWSNVSDLLKPLNLDKIEMPIDIVDTDGLRQNLTNTDLVLKLNSQLAVEEWNANTVVKSYDGYAHNEALGRLCDSSPSILSHQNVLDNLAIYINDPQSFICNNRSISSTSAAGSSDE